MTDLELTASLLLDQIDGSEITGGTLFFCHDTLFFPLKDWQDFPAVVLNWWLTALDEFVSQDMANVELDFMDGPYAVALRRLDSDTVEARFVRRNSTGELTMFRIDVAIKNLKESVEECVSHVLEQSALVPYVLNDVSSLKRTFDRLQQFRS